MDVYTLPSKFIYSVRRDFCVAIPRRRRPFRSRTNSRRPPPLEPRWPLDATRPCSRSGGLAAGPWSRDAPPIEFTSLEDYVNGAAKPNPKLNQYHALPIVLFRKQ